MLEFLTWLFFSPAVKILCTHLQAKEGHRSCSEKPGMSTTLLVIQVKTNGHLRAGIHPDNQAIKQLHSPVELASETHCSQRTVGQLHAMLNLTSSIGLPTVFKTLAGHLTTCFIYPAIVLSQQPGPFYGIPYDTVPSYLSTLWNVTIRWLVTPWVGEPTCGTQSKLCPWSSRPLCTRCIASPPPMSPSRPQRH